MSKIPFDPENLKIKRQKILNLFMDHNFHFSTELVDLFGSAWNQRKNIDLKAKGGLSFISKHVSGTVSLWEYRLVTPCDEIDLEHTCLKCKVPKPKLPLVNYADSKSRHKQTFDSLSSHFGTSDPVQIRIKLDQLSFF